ncbi:bifunctional metallophosphatase/5'-nucleotidase [bacterium]|nr:bifunctional metallophosphatase/5'-nucleotidase [bacterium]
MKKVAIILLLVLITAVFVDANETRKLIIVHTNDVHGGVTSRPATFINPDFPPEMGSIASQLTYLKRLRERYKEKGDGLLFLDAGDCFTGTPIGSLSKGEAVIRLMNQMGFDAMAVGNHEFDAGEENLKTLSQIAHFPFLSCNIIDKDTKELVSYVKPYIIKYFFGVKVAIIGLTTAETEITTFSENVANVQFLPEAETAQKYIDKVRAEGAEIVILLAHLGLPWDPDEAYREMLRKIDAGELKSTDKRLNAVEVAHFTEGVDLIIGGHIHIGHRQPWEHPEKHTLVVQNYANGGSIGTLMLKVDFEAKAIVGYEFPEYQSEIVTYFEEEFWPDPVLDSLLNTLQGEVEAGFDEVVGYTTGIITRGDAASNYAGYLVCDAMRENAGTDFAISNLGGVRAEIPGGEVTLRDLFNVMPFDNSIVVVAAPGSLMVKIFSRVASKHQGLLISGGKLFFDPKAHQEASIVKVEVEGQTMKDDIIYTLAVSDYLIDAYNLRYLEGFSHEIMNHTYVTIRDALTEYFRKHSPLSPEVSPRWKIISD